MPVIIKIIKLTSNELMIEPKKSESREYRDLSIELRDLKRQLTGYKLVEGEDYTYYPGSYPNTSPEYKLQFSGKSLVIRALYSIPIDLWEFDRNSYGSVPVSKEQFAEMRLQFAMTVTSKLCYHNEIAWVKAAQKTIFESLATAIYKLHNTINKSSTVIACLTADMQNISQREDLPFENSNFILLMAALSKAIHTEETTPTVTVKKLLIFESESKLLALYENLLKQYMPYVPKSINLLSQYQKVEFLRQPERFVMKQDQLP